MDETAIAFAPLHARPAATGPGQPPDRISLRDYVRSVDIGAFRSEQGAPQRLRFNVVLEVANHAAATTDDVDQVVSYDTIVHAIDAVLAAERVDLLETLAERVASGTLVDPRVLRAFVRVEKLDRVPGALGVEIVRARVPETAARLRGGALQPGQATPVHLVVFLSRQSLAAAGAAAWRAALREFGRPAVLCLGPEEGPGQTETEAQRRLALLAIEQAAWSFVDDGPGFEVVASRTELEHALRGHRVPVWAPARMFAAAPAAVRPDAADAAGLAAWLAGELGAAGLVLTGPEGVPPDGMAVHRIDGPGALREIG